MPGLLFENMKKMKTITALSITAIGIHFGPGYKHTKKYTPYIYKNNKKKLITLLIIFGRVFPINTQKLNVRNVTTS